MISRVLASAVILSLASCTSTYVPFAKGNVAPATRGGQGSDLDSVIYQGEEMDKTKTGKSSRSALLFMLGGRALDEAHWRPVEDQVTFGLEYTWVPAEGILGFEAGFAASAGVEDIVILCNLVTATGTTVEFYVGPRLETTLSNSPIRVYGGLGPSLIGAGLELEINGQATSRSDTSLAFYAHAGVLLELGVSTLAWTSALSRDPASPWALPMSMLTTRRLPSPSGSTSDTALPSDIRQKIARTRASSS